MPFAYNSQMDREALIEVLNIFKDKDIQVNTHFHYMARSKIYKDQDRAMSRSYIDKLQSMTNMEAF